MATHSSTLAWRIPWTEEPGRPAVYGVAQSRTQLSDFAFTFHFHALEKEMATHSSGWILARFLLKLENPRDGGPWWAAVYGVAQSWT